MNPDRIDAGDKKVPSHYLKRTIHWWRRELGRPDPIGIPLIVLSLIFFSSLILSPFLVDKGTIDLGDEGSVGSMDHDDVISEMENPIARAVYRFGDRYCHQKDHRSWKLNDNQMPVCARDIGLFLGIFLGCIFGACYRRGIGVLVLLGLIAPMVIDGGLQALTSYESHNILRLVTGTLGGFGIGAFINGSLVHTLRLLLFKKRKG